MLVIGALLERLVIRRDIYEDDGQQDDIIGFMLGDKAHYLENHIWRVYQLSADRVLKPVFAIIQPSGIGIQTIERHMTGASPFVCETLKVEKIRELLAKLDINISSSLQKRHICNFVATQMFVKHLQESIEFKFAKLVTFVL